MSKDTNIDFIITFTKGKLEELEKCNLDNGTNSLEKTLKLFATNTTSNMHLFDHNDKLCKFEKITDIIDCYYDVRLKLFQDRKDFIIKKLEKELLLLSNKTRYIKENLDGTIDLRRKNKDAVTHMLESKKYDRMDDDEEYKYLVKLPMDAVTEENVDKLMKEKTEKEKELVETQNTTICEMWIKELDKLKELYITYKEERTALMNGIYGVKEKEKEKKNVKKNSKKTYTLIE